ncbi:alpha/beta hydrolase [Rathayibacter sp. YIM 133350]|uniref:alpha/beta hydrolase n=1 Tax=Rathayibacter sp. YIM 133350 TaxID=3131992 RepID=UPI00307F62D7
MNPTSHPTRRRAGVALAIAALAVAAAATLSGFHVGLHDIDPPGSNRASELTTAQTVGIRTWQPHGGVRIEPDVTYGTRDDGTRLDLDVCSPAAEPANGQERVGVLSIHGGSWARGDKANDDWRRVCEWFASEGFVAFSVNYRLAPHNLFPAAIDDVSTAAEWVRDHAADYGIDPAHIGAFGGSAGGNLAALLGTRGTGPLDEGSRVAAVAELSGPVDLTDAGMRSAGASPLVHQIVQTYLGCTDLARCPQAKNASATSFVDPTDPPFFIGHSQTEFIPLGESTELQKLLQASDVPVELDVSAGAFHSIGILDEGMRAKVADFFRRTLGTVQEPTEPTVPTEAPSEGTVVADGQPATR